MSKQRLSVSVDSDLIEAVEHAVSRGRTDSISAWVNEALRSKLDHDRRLEALANFISLYESEHGEITPEEMRLAARRARSDAVTVRGAQTARKGATRSRRSIR
ncbi:MAG: hypothetical protein DMG14_17160 [Acidobacteria bacterium]|nr:MAG: hypothetical protein DMG14_17160 [Acidobacteriota bacterium]